MAGLTRRERLKQMSAMARCKVELLWGFGVQANIIRAMLSNLLCRGLYVATPITPTSRGSPSANERVLPHSQMHSLVGMSDDSW
jgi:hypothetical protein